MRVPKSMFGKGLSGCLVAVLAGGAMLASVPAAADEHGGPLEGKHIAFLLGEGFQDAEALVPLGYLVNRGAKVTVVGTAPGPVTAYNSAMQVYVDKAVGDVSADDFDGLVIPGGKAPADLREHKAVVAFARKMAKADKPIAAICHGPQVLVTAGVLDGKEATCYSGIADELREAGAEYADTSMVRDENIITSRLPKDLPDFCAAFEKALLEE